MGNRDTLQPLESVHLWKEATASGSRGVKRHSFMPGLKSQRHSSSSVEDTLTICVAYYSRLTYSKTFTLKNLQLNTSHPLDKVFIRRDFSWRFPMNWLPWFTLRMLWVDNYSFVKIKLPSRFNSLIHDDWQVKRSSDHLCFKISSKHPYKWSVECQLCNF